MPPELAATRLTGMYLAVMRALSFVLGVGIIRHGVHVWQFGALTKAGDVFYGPFATLNACFLILVGTVICVGAIAPEKLAALVERWWRR